jgi:uncharacterized protein YjbI with pentapeptide repeats
MKLVTIFSGFNFAEAQLVRARLEAADFHPFMANENAPVTLGGFSKATLIRVEVPEDEVAEVQEFLAAPAE